MRTAFLAFIFLVCESHATKFIWHFPNGFLSNLPDPGTADAAYQVDDIFNAVVTPDLDPWERNNSSCYPNPSPPKVVCIEVSNAVNPPATYIGLTQRNSGRASISKSRMDAWISDQRTTLGANATLEYLARGFAVIAAHEVGHAVDITDDFDGTNPNNQKYFMAQPTHPTKSAEWTAGEKTKLQSWLGPPSSVCPCPGPTNSNLYGLPVPPQMIAFSYPTSSTDYGDLSGHWGFLDSYNFQAESGNFGYAPPGFYSTHMSKSGGATSGWGTTPLFTTVDRDQEGLTISFKMRFYGDYTQGALAPDNYISISPSYNSGGGTSYQYNFYHRPKGGGDPGDTEDFALFKNGWSTPLNFMASWNYFIPMNDWIKFRIRIHKRQQAGGSGVVEMMYRSPWDTEWVQSVSAVDNDYRYFNTVDFWHSSSWDPALATEILVDDVLVENGIH